MNDMTPFRMDATDHAGTHVSGWKSLMERQRRVLVWKRPLRGEAAEWRSWWCTGVSRGIRSARARLAGHCLVSAVHGMRRGGTLATVAAREWERATGETGATVCPEACGRALQIGRAQQRPHLGVSMMIDGGLYGYSGGKMSLPW